MKNILSILFLTGFVVCNAQVYVNNETAYSNKADVFDNRVSINEISLKQDLTFEMWSRPQMSCWSWRSYKGTWKQINDTIILYDQYDVMEKDIKYLFNTNKKRKEYILNFKTDKNSEISNKNIEIQFVYDYTADIGDIKQIMSINADNKIAIPYKEVPNHNKLASIRIKYLLNSSKKRSGYITESNTVNVKAKNLPNIIDVEFIENPKEKVIYRTTKAIILDNKLKIISKSKTKTILPDFTGEITFEKYYKQESRE